MRKFIGILALISILLVPMVSWAADAKISADTTKTNPVAADLAPILDSQAANANKKITLGTIPLTGNAELKALTTGILKNTTTSGTPSIAVAGTDYQQVPTITYTLDGDITPVIPSAGGTMIFKLGVDTNGTTYTGITAARAVNAPITGTPVDGQLFIGVIYDDGVAARAVTFNAAFTPVGVVMASNVITSNGTVNKAVVITGRYNKAANKWQITGISYE